MTATPITGYFRLALNNHLIHRQRQVDRYIARVLLSLDDGTLSRHGYSRSDLKSRAAPTRF